jgi:YD repeat-containing protein
MTNTIKEYDNNGNEIYYRDSSGFEEWNDYDNNGNVIHYRNSFGYEVWREYDNNGKCIHYRDSTGREWRREYDTNGKLINTRNTSGATGHHHADAEEKVRGEYWEVVRKNLELLQRAERAEALVTKKENAIRVVEERLADAKREGAYEALTKLADKFVVDWGLENVAKTIRKFRDSVYAPTPARSVTMSGWVVTYDAKRDYAWHAKAPGRATHQHTLAELIASMGVPKAPDTEYTALCALAEGK